MHFMSVFPLQIAILNLVSHPHIIELIEVFDFFGMVFCLMSFSLSFRHRRWIVIRNTTLFIRRTKLLIWMTKFVIWNPNVVIGRASLFVWPIPVWRASSSFVKGLPPFLGGTSFFWHTAVKVFHFSDMDFSSVSFALAFLFVWAFFGSFGTLGRRWLVDLFVFLTGCILDDDNASREYGTLLLIL